MEEQNYLCAIDGIGLEIGVEVVDPCGLPPTRRLRVGSFSWFRSVPHAFLVTTIYLLRHPIAALMSVFGYGCYILSLPVLDTGNRRR